jgi:hypothetical protein
LSIAFLKFWNLYELETNRLRQLLYLTTLLDSCQEVLKT